MYVSEGLEVTETVSEMYPDFITQVLTTVDRFNQSEYGKVAARLDALEAAVNPSEGENNLTGRLIIAEGDIDDLKPRMTSAENSIGTLDERMDDAESDIDAVETRMSTAESDIDAVETRMSTAENAIDALEEIMGVEGDNATFNIVGPLGDPCTQLTTPGTYHMVVVVGEGSSSSRLFNLGIVCWDAICYESRTVVDFGFGYYLQIGTNGAINLRVINDDDTVSNVESSKYKLYARLLYAF